VIQNNFHVKINMLLMLLQCRYC